MNSWICGSGFTEFMLLARAPGTRVFSLAHVLLVVQPRSVFGSFLRSFSITSCIEGDEIESAWFSLRCG